MKKYCLLLCLGILPVFGFVAWRKASRAEVAVESDSIRIGSGNQPEKSQLVLRITGIQQVTGSLKVAVFADGLGYPDHEQASHRQTFGIDKSEAGEQMIGIDPLPPNNYAIAVFHDVDDNGILNRAAMGYPTEPYGFSNNARATFGPPEYSAAEFPAEAGEQAVIIEIR